MAAGPSSRLLAVDKIGVDNAAPVLSAAVAAAISGDTQAMEIILSRVWPARRGRPVLLPDLPRSIRLQTSRQLSAQSCRRSLPVARNRTKATLLAAWWTTSGVALSLSRSKRAWPYWRRKAMVERND